MLRALKKKKKKCSDEKKIELNRTVIIQFTVILMTEYIMSFLTKGLKYL